MKPTHFNRRAFVKTAVVSNAAAVARTPPAQPMQQQAANPAPATVKSAKLRLSPSDREQQG